MIALASPFILVLINDRPERFFFTRIKRFGLYLFFKLPDRRTPNSRRKERSSRKKNPLPKQIDFPKVTKENDVEV